MRKCTFNFIGMLCALLLIVACASSRRTISNVSTETMDSMSLSISDSLTHSEVRQGSISVNKSDSSSSKQSVHESGSDEAMITEHITEIIDASGTKTTTIDRTAKRTGNYNRQTDTDMLRKYQEAQLAMFIDSLDSVANSRANAYKAHWNKNDSLKNEKDKNTSDIKPSSIWDRWRTILIVILCVLFFYVRNKKR